MIFFRYIFLWVHCKRERESVWCSLQLIPKQCWQRLASKIDVCGKMITNRLCSFSMETQDGHQTRIAQAFRSPATGTSTKTDTPATSQETSKATRPPPSFAVLILPSPTNYDMYSLRESVHLLKTTLIFSPWSRWSRHRCLRSVGLSK